MLFQTPRHQWTRDDAVKVARLFIGQPYKKREMDCLGLILHIARFLDYLPASYHISDVYQFKAHRNAVALLDENMERANNLQAGDVLLFSGCHLAVLSDDRRIIHARRDVGRVSEHRVSDEDWGKLTGGWTFRGIT